MATPQGTPNSPTIPLAPEVRAAYEDLYKKMQDALDNTMDADVVEALNTWQPQVDRILKQDDEYKLTADTNIFEALQQQIDTTNKGLKVLQGQISSIASHFAMAGEIIGAINKVLSLVPGA